MGADENQDDAPQGSVQTNGYHQVKLRTQHNGSNGDKHGAGLQSYIELLAREPVAVHCICRHGGNQQSAHRYGNADVEAVPHKPAEIGLLPGGGIVGELPAGGKEGGSGGQLRIGLEGAENGHSDRQQGE
ncbi:hypothetical protein D3C75_1037230 [compost metagenome]